MIGLVPAACLGASLLLSRSESTEGLVQADAQAVAAALSGLGGFGKPPREVCVARQRVDGEWRPVRIYERAARPAPKVKRPFRDQQSNPWVA